MHSCNHLLNGYIGIFSLHMYVLYKGAFQGCLRFWFHIKRKQISLCLCYCPQRHYACHLFHNEKETVLKMKGCFMFWFHLSRMEKTLCYVCCPTKATCFIGRNNTRECEKCKVESYLDVQSLRPKYMPQRPTLLCSV